MSFSQLPEELRAQPGLGWVVWCWEDDPDRPGKRRKPPFRTDDPSRHASSTDPSTWGTFEQAVSLVTLGAADGIGFALAPPYVGVDLDEELPETDRYAIMLALASYAEVSVSGTGHHVILKASLNGGRHPAGIGVFQTGRFWYCTGEHVTGTPETIEERQDELEEVLAEYLPTRKIDLPGVDRSAPQPVDLDDQELLERAFAARNGAKFRRLWEGDWSGYPSQSDADLALCSLLAFWTGRDAGRMERMFRSSGLYREKWDRQDNEGRFDYRELTIGNAIAGTSEVYEVQRSTPNAGDAEGEKAGPAGGTGGAFEVQRSAYRNFDTPTLYPQAVETKSGSASTLDSDPIFALPIRDFIARDREHRDPLLASADGRAVIGCHSLTLLGALGGHGKTTLSVDVFLHLAAGVDFPPWTVPRPVSVLLIENEGPEELFAEKLAARLEHFPHELKARLDVCTFDWGGFSLANDAHRLRLTQEIADKGYELVFGDPLDALGIEGVGSPEDTRKFLELMKQTGLNKTVAWWLNTHPRKEETKDALNEISGAWGGKPDSVFLLRMLEDDRTQVRQPKLRWARRGKGATLLFAFDPDTEAFAYVGEQTEEERDYLAEIRELFSDGEWRLVKDIATGIKAGEKAVKPILDEHPDLFEMRTGEEAVALGRRAIAQLWNLRTGEADA